MQDFNYQLKPTGHIAWVDTLRGLCMGAILLDHTEIYYTGENIIDYGYYVTNALVAFFFLSGYLFYKDTPFSLRHKLMSVGRCLILPYFLFTTLIAVPKALVHGADIGETLLTVIMGEASWFVAALIVAEIAFSIVLWAGKGKTWTLSTLAVAASSGCYVLSTYHIDLYWQVGNACMAIVILCFGYSYHKYEKVINRFHTLSSSFFFFLLFIIIKVYESANNIDLIIKPIIIGNWYVFVFDVTAGTLFLVSLAKQIGDVTWLEWTGRHSLVFYFFSGGIPLVTSAALRQINFNYTGSYQRVMVAFLLVYVLSAIAARIVYRYFPFMVGKTKKYTSFCI